MRLKLFVCMLCLVYPMYGQVVMNNYYNRGVYRSMDPRAEAMGKIQSVGENKYFNILSNPALDNSGKEISAYFSYSDDPYYSFLKASIRNFGVTYNIGTIGSFGASMESFNYGESEYLNFDATEELYSFSYSNKIADILNFGITANLIVDNKFKITNNATFFDIGLSKKFSMYENEQLKHELNAGLQVINVTSKKIQRESIRQYYYPIVAMPFPSILRIGMEDVLTFYKNNDKDYKYVTLKTAIEYEDLLNAKTLSAIKFGAELITLDLLSLRVGYYYRFEEYKGTYTYYYNDAYLYQWNYHYDYSKGQFTYGVGLNLDFKQLLNGPPLVLTIDFVSLDQSFKEQDLNEGDYISTFSFGNFQTVLARVRYIVE